MFDTLMESRPRRERRVAGTIASVVVHVAIVGAAALATMRTVSPVRASPVPEHPIWVAPAPPSGDAAVPTGSAAAGAGQSVDTPSDIVTRRIDIAIDAEPGLVAPAIDLREVLGVFGDPPGGGASASGSGSLARGGIFVAGSVERPAALRADGPTPRYPASLRAASIEGRVTVRFVVDTLGRIEPGTPVLLASTDPRFTAAVQDVLPRLRFTPAMAGGRTVRMYVEMPFEFRIEHR